jgi:hypothetical protein
LTQESQVIFEEQADVRNAVITHYQPFYPESEQPNRYLAVAACPVTGIIRAQVFLTRTALAAT